MGLFLSDDGAFVFHYLGKCHFLHIQGKQPPHSFVSYFISFVSVFSFLAQIFKSRRSSRDNFEKRRVIITHYTRFTCRSESIVKIIQIYFMIMRILRHISGKAPSNKS